MRPHITDEFHSLSDANWYASAYLLASPAFQPTWGKVYQIFISKKAFTFAMVLFLIGSLVSGVAQNSTSFIMGRAIAGLGAGGVLTGVLTIVVYVVPLHRRAVFTSVFSLLFGVLP